MMNLDQILIKLSTEFNDVYEPKDKLPKPYFNELENVKVIILGCDPSNVQGDVFNEAFGLTENLKYFRGINNNIKMVGLDKSEMYVDNLCRNYFKMVTYKNKKWQEIANRLWIQFQKDELDKHLPNNIPILATSAIILKALSFPGIYKDSMNECLYKDCIYIKENENKLGRKIIPFFRHYKYSLSKWGNYASFVKDIIESDSKKVQWITMKGSDKQNSEIMDLKNEV